LIPLNLRYDPHTVPLRSSLNNILSCQEAYGGDNPRSYEHQPWMTEETAFFQRRAAALAAGIPMPHACHAAASDESLAVYLPAKVAEALPAAEAAAAAAAPENDVVAVAEVVAVAPIETPSHESAAVSAETVEPAAAQA
jgi:hypothetical protein